jgi:Holliday junction resolvase-like predicted endonuclease
MTVKPIDIEKSSRHPKIIGSLGEHLVCNWLSRSGFEVAVVDHTGIDVIAYNPKTKERLGITVKSRTSARRERLSLHSPFL